MERPLVPPEELLVNQVLVLRVIDLPQAFEGVCCQGQVPRGQGRRRLREDVGLEAQVWAPPLMGGMAPDVIKGVHLVQGNGGRPARDMSPKGVPILWARAWWAM